MPEVSVYTKIALNEELIIPPALLALLANAFEGSVNKNRYTNEVDKLIQENPGIAQIEFDKQTHARPLWTVLYAMRKIWKSNETHTDKLFITDKLAILAKKLLEADADPNVKTASPRRESAAEAYMKYLDKYLNTQMRLAKIFTGDAKQEIFELQHAYSELTIAFLNKGAKFKMIPNSLPGMSKLVDKLLSFANTQIRCMDHSKTTTITVPAAIARPCP